MKRSVLDDDTANGDGLQLGHRRERAGAPHLDIDVLEKRRCLLGRKLVRHGPTRVARNEAEALLQVQPIYFVDDAVDVVLKLTALKPDLVVEREQLFNASGFAPGGFVCEADGLRATPAFRTVYPPASR